MYPNTVHDVTVAMHEMDNLYPNIFQGVTVALDVLDKVLS